jgi:HPt (histidine-containing phosphotransfer) domain-containing protein
VPETNWNLSELLERLDNDRAFLELLAVFRQDSHVALEQARDALSKQDLATLERSAHTLKGMLRNLLMEHAAKIASELELAARQGRPQDSGPLLRQLRTVARTTSTRD